MLFRSDAGLGFAVEGDVDGIQAGEVEFQLLEGDDEIACPEMGIARQDHFGGEIDAGHDEAAVGVDEIQAQFVRAFVLMAESDAQGNGALRVRGRNLLSDDGVKRAQQVELPVFFRGGIAQNSDLNIHPAEIKHEIGQMARISLSVFEGDRARKRESRRAGPIDTERQGLGGDFPSEIGGVDSKWR